LNGDGVKAPAKPERSTETVDRILLVATRLFAARGFDAVSTREIAAAVGLNVATVNYHVGGKRDLYVAVLKRIEEVQADVFFRTAGALLPATGPLTRETLVAFIDGLLEGLVELALEHPYGPVLRMRQSLDPVAEDAQEFQAFTGLIGAVETTIARAKEAGLVDATLDARMFARAFIWIVQGYFVGAPRPGERRIDPSDPAELSAFRAYLRRYTLAMLGLAAEPRKKPG
jgi:AcrR family transcriptional regulator